MLKLTLLLLAVPSLGIAAESPSPLPPEKWKSSALLLELEKIAADVWGESIRAVKSSPGLFPANKENHVLRDQFAKAMKKKKAVLTGTLHAQEGNGFRGEWNLGIRCREKGGWDRCEICSEHHLNGRKLDFTHSGSGSLSAYTAVDGQELVNPGNPNLSVRTGMPYVGGIYALPVAFEPRTEVWAYDLNSKTWVTAGKMEWTEGAGKSCFDPLQGDGEREPTAPAAGNYREPSLADIAHPKRSEIWLEGTRRKEELRRHFVANWKENNSYGIRGLQGMEDDISREADAKARAFLGKKKRASFAMRVQLAPSTDTQLLLDFMPENEKGSLMRFKAVETQFGVTNGYISFNDMNSHRNELYTYQPRLGSILLFGSLGSEEIISFGGRYDELRVEFPLSKEAKEARIFGWNVDLRDWEILNTFSWKELTREERDALIADWKRQDFNAHPEQRPKFTIEAEPLK